MEKKIREKGNVVLLMDTMAPDGHYYVVRVFVTSKTSIDYAFRNLKEAKKFYEEGEEK